MLLLCDSSVILPLKIICQNTLETSTYPDMWKLANVTPIFKKGDKQILKNYMPISSLPICGKIFEKSTFNNLYSYFKLSSSFRMDLDGELVVERNYIKSLFAVRRHTPNA